MSQSDQQSNSSESLRTILVEFGEALLAQRRVGAQPVSLSSNNLYEKTLQRIESVCLPLKQVEAEKLDSYIRGINYAGFDLMRHDKELTLKRLTAEIERLQQRQRSALGLDKKKGQL